MYCEPFLFTRNQRQDFTCFIRPAGLTNKDISAIAGALNNVSDISRLTRAFPSRYYFRLGDYVLLLRHYNSGRRHAGREIGIVEGIGVKRTRARHFALAVPYFVTNQDEVLAIADDIPDIEMQTVQAATGREMPEQTAQIAVEDTLYLDEFVERRSSDRLFLPFNRGGLELLAAALADRRFTAPLYFAFGTNSDVMGALAGRGIEVDIIGYFSTDQACFRSRETNQKTGDVRNAIDEPAFSEMTEPPMPPVVAPRPEAPREVLTSVEDTTGVMSLRSKPAADRAPLPEVRGVEDVPEDERPLTPRQMRQRMRAEEVVERAAPPKRGHFDPLRWLARIIFGSKSGDSS